MRVYLDSCVVIYLIEGPEDLSRAIRSELVPEEAPHAICFSELTRLECRVGPVRKDDPDRLAQFDAFFATRGIEMIPFDREIFDLATRIRATHGTKTPDALHLAAAVAGQCGEFWTNDHRLTAASRERIEIRVLG